mgnify:CR=1 FL=1
MITLNRNFVLLKYSLECGWDQKLFALLLVLLQTMFELAEATLFRNGQRYFETYCLNGLARRVCPDRHSKLETTMKIVSGLK